VTVSQGSTVTLLSAAHNPIASGAAATFTIEVSPNNGGSTTAAPNIPFGGCGPGGQLQASSPSGTVTISAVEPDGSTVVLGSAELNNGRATFSTTDLPAGTSTITAVYNGDTNYTGSTSQSVSLTVNSATSTVSSSRLSVNVSSPPVVVNTATTLSIAVNAGKSSTVGTAPSGTVTLYDATTGTSLTGTSPVSLAAASGSSTNSAGSISATFTTPGLHLIVATYSGDSNYASQTITIPVYVQSTSTNSGGSGYGGFGFGGPFGFGGFGFWF
jgi:hypothetical protein